VTNENLAPARIVLGVAVVGAILAISFATWLPAAQSRSGTLCAPPTPTATPTEGPSPTPTESPPSADRCVTLSARKAMVTTGGTVTMTGNLTDASGAGIAGVNIRIEGETLGTGVPAKGGRAETNDEGEFFATVKVGASAEFTAVAPGETKQDPEVTSAPVTVLSKVIMTARTRSLTPERGTKIEIGAKVRPPHPGSEAKLQRKTERGWRQVLRDRANDTGFSFKLKATWKGKRIFRVTWIKSDDDHEPSSSNWLRIKTVEPRDGGDRNRRRGR
jgi:hypothetical protein